MANLDDPIVARALAAVQAITGTGAAIPIPGPKGAAPARLATLSELADDCERRFGQPHARLFPYLGRRVQTPAGKGTLLQVFAHRVTVDCGDIGPDGMGKVRFFQPAEIEVLQ